ncbi:MAG: TlpA disulfide reductase family protein [Chloroflexota bacterium]
MEESQTPQPEIQPANRFRFNLVAGTVGLLVAGYLLLVGWGLNRDAQPPPVVGNRAAKVNFEWYENYSNGNAPYSSINDFEGKYVVLNFWASWCVPCWAETPDLQAFHENYSNEVEMIGVSYITTESKAIDFLEALGVTFGNAQDLGGSLSSTYEITQVPQTFVIDPDGMIIGIFYGQVSYEQLQEITQVD